MVLIKIFQITNAALHKYKNIKIVFKLYGVYGVFNYTIILCFLNFTSSDNSGTNRICIGQTSRWILSSEFRQSFERDTDTISVVQKGQWSRKEVGGRPCSVVLDFAVKPLKTTNEILF